MLFAFDDLKIFEGEIAVGEGVLQIHEQYWAKNYNKAASKAAIIHQINNSQTIM